MTIWTELDDLPEVWSSYGRVLEKHPTLLRAIMEDLPPGNGKPDTVDRVQALYRWLVMAGCESAQIHRGWHRDWSVSMNLTTDLGVGGVHDERRVLDSSAGTKEGIPHAWTQLSKEQAWKAILKARPAGVVRWMHALHQAEMEAIGKRPEMLVVKILSPAPGNTDMQLLALDEYVQHAVERRKHRFITFHEPNAPTLAQIQARRLGETTMTIRPPTTSAPGRRL